MLFSLASLNHAAHLFFVSKPYGSQDILANLFLDGEVSADMHLSIAVRTVECFCAEVLTGLNREVICDTVFKSMCQSFCFW